MYERILTNLSLIIKFSFFVLKLVIVFGLFSSLKILSKFIAHLFFTQIVMINIFRDFIS